MPRYYGIQSQISRKQKFEWGKDGVLLTEPATERSPMINSAYTNRPPELYANPTVPIVNSSPMFLKTYGVPRS